jgi:hypothetical protein
MLESKIRRLQQHLRGWAKNVSGANKKEKKRSQDKLDMLDKREFVIYGRSRFKIMVA